MFRYLLKKEAVKVVKLLKKFMKYQYATLVEFMSRKSTFQVTNSIFKC